jgi:hypothetical protein
MSDSKSFFEALMKAKRVLDEHTKKIEQERMQRVNSKLNKKK